MVLAADGDSDFFGALHDFFGSGSWPVVRNLSIFLLVIFWLAVGYWVFKDARRRIEDPWLVGAATVLGLVPPFVGALIYMLFRPGPPRAGVGGRPPLGPLWRVCPYWETPIESPAPIHSPPLETPRSETG